jgi:hypothetical protein
VPQQVIGEPGVLRQQRAVQVAGVHVARNRTLGAVLAVVARADLDVAERRAARPQVRFAAVVLEADERVALGVPGAAHDAVADVAALAGHRPRVEHADAGQDLAAARAELAPEELVAAADRQHHRARVDGLAQRGALVRHQVGGHNGLLAVLAAAEEIQVVGRGVGPVP